MIWSSLLLQLFVVFEFWLLKSIYKLQVQNSIPRKMTSYTTKGHDSRKRFFLPIQKSFVFEEKEIYKIVRRG